MASVAKFKFDLGDEAIDKITDFKGIITSRSDHISNCNTYWLQPKTKDGSHIDGRWVDEPLLDKIKKVKKPVPEKKRTGGPIACSLPHK